MKNTNRRFEISKIISFALFMFFNYLLSHFLITVPDDSPNRSAFVITTCFTLESIAANEFSNYFHLNNIHLLIRSNQYIILQHHLLYDNFYKNFVYKYHILSHYPMLNFSYNIYILFDDLNLYYYNKSIFSL